VTDDVEERRKMEHAALTCIQCGHVWHPHYPHMKPRICPSCRSQQWEKPKETQPAPVVEVVDPPATISGDQGISNDELIEEIKDLRKQVEQLKEKLEQIEKRCDTSLCIKTL
jgi:predicted Zn-ribbon and HTH transcriptional regulator